MITLDWERGKDWVVYDGRETVSFRKQEVRGPGNELRA